MAIDAATSAAGLKALYEVPELTQQLRLRPDRLQRPVPIQTPDLGHVGR